MLCIKKLEKKWRLSGELNITKRINTLFNQEVDDLQQYQKRSCIFIDGINHKKDESVADITSKNKKNVLNKHLQTSKEEIEKQYDKCHRNGPKNDNGTQTTILKFKSHSFQRTGIPLEEENQEQKNQNHDFPHQIKA